MYLLFLLSAVSREFILYHSGSAGSDVNKGQGCVLPYSVIQAYQFLSSGLLTIRKSMFQVSSNSPRHMIDNSVLSGHVSNSFLDHTMVTSFLCLC